jgi:hypothetical protein
MSPATGPSVKMQKASTHKGQAKAAIKYIRDHCVERLNSTPEMNPDDLNLIKTGLQDITDHHIGLSNIIDNIHDENIRQLLYQLTTKIALTSFILGVAERVPDGLKKHHLARRSASGGKDGGITRKKNAKDKWGNQVERIVTEICAKPDRKWSKLGLVSEIKDRWTGDDNALPKADKTIIRKIDEMLEAGKISLDI